jgi:hypothetical protein
VSALSSGCTPSCWHTTFATRRHFCALSAAQFTGVCRPYHLATPRSSGLLLRCPRGDSSFTMPPMIDIAYWAAVRDKDGNVHNYEVRWCGKAPEGQGWVRVSL